MTNAYVSLDTLKSPGVLNITGSGDDVRLLGLIESVSRMIDRYCNRHFYVQDATRHFDGDGSATLLVPDLVGLDADGLKTDDARDGSFGTTWDAADYLLLPLNADPASSGNPQSRPYSRIEADTIRGSHRAFPRGRKTVQVTGRWGWWSHLRQADETASAVADATTTSVTVSSRADVEAGHTIVIDEEQMYVRGYSSNTLSVVRGVNGATAASHADGSAIYIHDYPGPVVEAAIIQASRLWRRKDGAFSGQAGFPETGRLEFGSGLDPDAMLLLGQYRKLAVGVGS